MSRLLTGVAEAQAQQQQGRRDRQSWLLLREFAASGISVGTANTVLNPVEVIKTRMQLNGAAAVLPAAALAQRPAAPAAAGAAGAGYAPVAAPTYAAASTTPVLQASSSSSAARFFSHSAGYRGVTDRGLLKPSGAPGAAVTLPLPPSTAAAVTAVTGASGGQSAQRALTASLESVAAAAAAAGGGAVSLPAPHLSSCSSGSVMGAGLLATPSAAAAAAVRRPGFLATAGIILQAEGPRGFARGIQASASRAVLNGGIRLGLYDPIKTLMSSNGSGSDLHMGQKLAAGSISGCIGAVLTTPIELAKTRLQAPSATTRSMSEVLRSVVAQHGVGGLWRGATPSVLRLILLNGSMVGVYDEVKGRIRSVTGWTSGLHLVLASSMVAGLVTTTVINPADVCRAYMQTGRGTSLAAVARGIWGREGPAGFLKGWTAAYARTGPQTLIIFTVSELVRPAFGLSVIGGSG